MSAQQDAYLRLRAHGEEPTAAAAAAGILFGEARLIEAAVNRGEIEIPAAGQADPQFGEKPMAETEDLLDREEVDGVDIVDPTVTLAADTLRGDIRDSLLDWLKATPKPWSQMGEAEQRDMAAAANRFAGTLVREACQLIAANERPCIVAQLVEYKEKDGVEAKLKLPSKGDVVAALHEACGREVLVVTSGAEEFMGQAADAKIDPDQAEIHGIGEEYQEAAE